MTSLVDTVGKDLEEWDALDQKSKDLYTEALQLVCESDDTARLRAIFNDKNDLDINKNLVPVYGETLLFQALVNENLVMAKELLELGADPKAENAMDGETPLEWLEQCESRNETQQKIYALLLAKTVPEACSNCGQKPVKLLICTRCKRVRYCSKDCQKAHWKGHKPTCKPKEKKNDPLHDAFTVATWAVGHDPQEIERMRNSNDLFSSLFVRQVTESAMDAMRAESPGTLKFLAERNKKRHAAKKVHDWLDEEQRALIQEAFELLEIAETDALPCEAFTLVARIKEIYSKPGMDVNFPSEKGDRLLFEIVVNYRLDEEDPNAQLELVKFLLEKGVDPNLENQCGDTALDEMDYEIEFDDLTPQQTEITRLLREAGGLIQAANDDGEKYGERGDTIGRHQTERLKRQQKKEGESS